MCGIHGVLSLGPAAGESLRHQAMEALEAMDRCLAARGPDGRGLWLRDGSPVALGHRRLAILDPTPRGDQPMASADGRHVIVYNGEIYNFRRLRRELADDGHAFRTTTDTEVLLALYARHGTAMLDRLRGMYAFALWDGEKQELVLARDPLGIKPLYYSRSSDGRLYFASQVRALEAVPSVSAETDPAGLAGFLLWGSVPEPFTLRREIRALPAGHHLRIPAGHHGPLPAPEPHGAPRESHPDVPSALESSVRAHLVSDVPVAVFLSAGLDSTLVAALATRHLPEPPVTFTLAIDEAHLPGEESGEGSEAAAAARVASALGTRHVERSVTRADLDALWPEVLSAMDQPSIDGFNTFVVSRLAHEAGIKVALSGLGGDELLGGYPSFGDVPRLHRWARRLDRLPLSRALLPPLARLLFPSRPKLAGLLPHALSFPGAYFLRRGLFLPEELPALLGPDLAREGLLELSRQMPATCPTRSDASGSHLSRSDRSETNAASPAATATHPLQASGSHLSPTNACHPSGQVAAICRAPLGTYVDPADPWRSVHRLETARYLRNQLLRDADWAGMASSVEIRVPLVDETLRQALVEDPASPLLADGPPDRDAKRRIVRATAPELPAEVFERPKQGFYVPVGGGPDEGDGDGAAAGRSRGLDSRALALRLLRERGVR
jgi:asparagine synthase (glutamine-hydrolysing)